MRKALVLFVFVLVLAGAWPRPSLADCPGTSACVYNKGCPKGSKPVGPGQSIQQAIDAAPGTGATLCVAPGNYIGLINFHGKPINLVSSGGPAVTFLDGGGGGPVVTLSSAEGKDSILDGFTIRNGKATYGAGISISGASPTIRNSILTKNAAIGSSGRGGGVGVIGIQAHPSITCTQFLGNTADFTGGGLMSTYSANPYLRSNLFEGNKAPFGGAIGVAWSGRLDLGWTQLLGNQASSDGGGIHAGVPYGNVLVRQVWFKGNKAGSNGGGMWVPAGLAEVLNSTFDSNQAAAGGGIAAGFGSMVSVASTLFVRNTTTNSGSAALVNANGSNTSVVNHYNGFFGNSGANFLNTYGDKGLLIAGTDPLGGSCCPGPGSPAINAGIPELHFNDPNGSRNDIGACGGPALSTFGPVEDCSKKVVVSGLHFPNKTCAQSSAEFQAGLLTSSHFTSKCPQDAPLKTVLDISCQNAPIPGFATGSVYQGTACCVKPAPPVTFSNLSMQGGDEKTPCPALGVIFKRSDAASVPYLGIMLPNLDQRCGSEGPGLLVATVKFLKCAPDPRGKGFGPNASADITCAK